MSTTGCYQRFTSDVSEITSGCRSLGWAHLFLGSAAHSVASVLGQALSEGPA